MVRLLRLWHTLRHLRPVQLYGRIWFRLARPRPDLSAPPPLRQRGGAWQAPAERQPSLTGPETFLMLNEAGSLSAHGWDGPDKPRLWRYNQHYFDDLNAVGAPARADWHRALIARWIAENPAGQGPGWEPYPTSLRIVNWVKWSLAGNALGDATTESLAVQTRWLSRRMEWHLLGNHLFANAKALVFAGLHFDGPEAAGWLSRGAAILARQIPEQILPDGGQFELSPMYHALALEDMLDLVNIARAQGRGDLAQSWALRVPAMLDWLAQMSHPDGAPALFNDAASGIAPDTARLVAYAQSLGFAAPGPLADCRLLPASGYARLTRGPALLLADLARVGPDYLPGHAHADTLSFELSLRGRRLIVNSGTSLYGLGEERLRQRGTGAHSTVMIDGQDSSEVWSGFRVGRRARPLGVSLRDEGQALIATGAHDGYRYLPGAPLHRRTWRLSDADLTVTDRIDGAGPHRIEAMFHLAPLWQPEVLDAQTAQIRDESGTIVATVAVTGGTLGLVRSSWHPQFGLSLPSLALRLQVTAVLPVSLETLFQWAAP